MKLPCSLYARPEIIQGQQCAEAQPGPRSATVELPGCGHGQNRGGSVLPPSSSGCRSPHAALPRRILGRRSAIGQRRRAGRECQDACYAVRRRPVPTVWRPLSGPAVPGPTVRGAGVHGPVVRCPVVRCPVVRCPTVRCPTVRVSGHLVSAASALSASRSAVGSVRPGADDAGGGLDRPAGQYRPRSGRVSLGCGCGRARPADRRGGQAVARIAVGCDRASVGSGLSTMLPHLPCGCAPMPSGAERA
jgi:hypothetical protein